MRVPLRSKLKKNITNKVPLSPHHYNCRRCQGKRWKPSSKLRLLFFCIWTPSKLNPILVGISLLPLWSLRCRTKLSCLYPNVVWNVKVRNVTRALAYWLRQTPDATEPRRRSDARDAAFAAVRPDAGGLATSRRRQLRRSQVWNVAFNATNGSGETMFVCHT